MLPIFLRAYRLCRSFQRGPQQIRAVENIGLRISAGEFLAIVGASGSGKSTLLNLLAGLDTPTSGTIEIHGRDLQSMTRRQLSSYRANTIGMVFQTFNLLPYRSAVQNVELALYFRDLPRRERRSRSVAVLEQLGLGDRIDHRPGDLSGGEQQRVAIARALVKQPDIILADEPTGNLDRDNASQIARLLAQLNSNGLTVVMVTHDETLAQTMLIVWSECTTVRLLASRRVGNQDESPRPA